MSEDPKGMIGPANWVDPVTYRQLKKKFIEQGKKSASKKKKSTSKKRRRTTYGRTFSAGRKTGPIIIDGSGGYWTDKLMSGASAAYRALQRGVPQGTFARLGQAAGGAMFGGSGATLGHMAGSGVANVLGFGDYAIRRNELLQIDEGLQVPTFQDLNQGVIICHREYIGDITQSTAFTLSSYPINPGQAKTFPWLSTIAPCFDQYEILGMLFQFRSTASDFGTTSNMAMGTVIMATEYDTVDSNYASKLEMENAQYSLSGKPSQDMLHAIECDPSLTGPSGLKYVRTGGVPSGKDIRLYDHGNFQLATTGMPASTGIVGELWVTYKIAFYKPQLPLSTGVRSAYLSAASWNTSNYFGIGVTADSNNSITTTVSGNVLTITGGVAVGEVIAFTYYQKFGSTAIGGGLLVATTGLTGVDSTQTETGTLTQYQYWAIFKVTADNPTITLSNLTNASGQTVVRTWITALDKDVAYSAYSIT